MTHAIAASLARWMQSSLVRCYVEWSQRSILGKYKKAIIMAALSTRIQANLLLCYGSWRQHTSLGKYRHVAIDAKLREWQNINAAKCYGARRANAITTHQTTSLVKNATMH
jgi:hypothetical protein